jgi:hypothetical protein
VVGGGGVVVPAREAAIAWIWSAVRFVSEPMPPVLCWMADWISDAVVPFLVLDASGPWQELQLDA